MSNDGARIGVRESGRGGRALAATQARVLLLKPRVMSLVVFTGGVGLAVAPGSVDWITAIVTLVAMAGGAGACGALNMWYDADIDAVMTRTAARPIPTGRVSPAETLVYGIVLALLSVWVLGAYVNAVAATLLALTIFIYFVIYTVWLKRRTPQNIVIGGASGALPPMIGWAAATGSVDAGAIAMFLIIFLWTPPHFWALALARKNDYEAVGVPMMPVSAGPEATIRQILVYSVLLGLASLLPIATGIAGWAYGAAAIALSTILLERALALARASDEAQRTRAAYRLFGFSILYMTLVFVALLIGAT